MTERIASNVGRSRLEIAYEEHGDRANPSVLLIMGMAAQLIHWPRGFVAALVDRGLHVVRFDNRDCGRSTHVAGAPPPDFAAAMAGDYASASYTLSDMAVDAVGLLDALGIRRAHLVGASMGGAIAQVIATAHAERACSLTLMMSTTGNTNVGQAHPATLAAVFSGNSVLTRTDAVARAVRAFSIVGSPAFPGDPTDIAETAGLAYDRGHDEAAIARQAIAALASGDRTESLRNLRVPALVIHGLADTVCDPSGGRATAEAIPGAELVLVKGMGHNLPAALWNDFADSIASVVRRGESMQSGQR